MSFDWPGVLQTRTDDVQRELYADLDAFAKAFESDGSPAYLQQQTGRFAAEAKALLRKRLDELYADFERRWNEHVAEGRSLDDS